MLSKQLKGWGETSGWSSHRSSIFGEYKGFWFHIKQERSFVSFCVVVPLDTFQRRAIEPLLSSLMVAKQRLFFTSAESYLRVTVAHGLKGLKAEDITHVVEGMYAALVEVGVRPVRCCGECVIEGEYLATTVGTHSIMPMCDHCYGLGERDTAQTKQELSESDYGYSMGIAGALLGGVIATVPWIIVGRMGFFASILGLIIGSGALYGYRLAGARTGPKTRWIILFSTLLCVLFAHTLSLAMELAEVGIPINLLTYRILFTDRAFFDLSWGRLSIATVMALIGVRGIFSSLGERLVVPELQRLQ